MGDVIPIRKKAILRDYRWNSREFIQELSEKDLKYLHSLDVIDASSGFCRFYDLRYVKDLGFTTSSCSDMNCMFYSCYSMIYADISNIDFSSATNTIDMFGNCRVLKTLKADFTGRDYRFIESMFEDCYQLKELDLTGMDTSKAYKMGYMFSGCGSLHTIKGILDFSSCKHYTHIFYQCYSLSKKDPVKVRLPLNISKKEFIMVSAVPDPSMIQFIL